MHKKIIKTYTFPSVFLYFNISNSNAKNPQSVLKQSLEMAKYDFFKLIINAIRSSRNMMQRILMVFLILFHISNIIFYFHIIYVMKCVMNRKLKSVYFLIFYNFL